MWPPGHFVPLLTSSFSSDLSLGGTFDKQSSVRGAWMIAKDWVAEFNALRPLQETEWTTAAASLSFSLRYTLWGWPSLRLGRFPVWDSASSYSIYSDKPVFLWKFARPLLSCGSDPYPELGKGDCEFELGHSHLAHWILLVTNTGPERCAGSGPGCPSQLRLSSRIVLGATRKVDDPFFLDVSLERHDRGAAVTILSPGGEACQEKEPLQGMQRREIQEETSYILWAVRSRYA